MRELSELLASDFGFLSTLKKYVNDGWAHNYLYLLQLLKSIITENVIKFKFASSFIFNSLLRKIHI